GRATRRARPAEGRRAGRHRARRRQRAEHSPGATVAGMISRYTSPEMGLIWSDQRKYETWLQVELAAVDAMARAGIVPAEAAREIRARAAFNVDRIEEIEQVTQHDVIAFTTAVGERVGPSARGLPFWLCVFH